MLIGDDAPHFVIRPRGIQQNEWYKDTGRNGHNAQCFWLETASQSVKLEFG